MIMSKKTRDHRKSNAGTQGEVRETAAVDQLSENDRALLFGQLAGVMNEWAKEQGLNEAFTQADIELALDDRGWLVGGKRMAGELDPLSRQVQVNKSRYYWLRDPLAKQAVRLWTDYSFGAEALSYSCDDKSITKNLDKFMKDRRNRRSMSRAGQRRLSTKLLVDGEIFLAFYDDGTVRIIDPLQITDIITDPDDEDTVLAYKRKTAGANGTTGKTLFYKPWELGEENDAQPIDPESKKPVNVEENVVMYHIALDALETRGNPLISACSDWSREHRRFMTARVALQQALSRFAYKINVKGGQKVINSIRSKMESTFAQTGLSGGTEHQPPNAPGGSWLQNDGVDIQAMPRTTGGSDAKADADSLKLMVSAGTGIMLHYFGDPSTGNLATATAMELPMLKMFGAYQQFWKDTFRDIFAIVLEEDPDSEPAVITIELPTIIEDDLQKLGQFLTQLATVFPEAKVPQVLEMCLTSMGCQNVADIMKDAKALRVKLDAQPPLGAPGAPQPKPGDPPQGGAAGTNQDQTESLKKLIESVERLARNVDVMSAVQPRPIVEASPINVTVESKPSKSVRKTVTSRRTKDGGVESVIEESNNG
jgi:hypothetical protein